MSLMDEERVIRQADKRYRGEPEEGSIPWQRRRLIAHLDREREHWSRQIAIVEDALARAIERASKAEEDRDDARQALIEARERFNSNNGGE